MITINTNYSNINFKHFRHDIVNKSGKVINRGDTCFFRQDLDFDYFINYMEFKYCDKPKVNIIAHACSDGEEVYSLVSKMIDSLGLKPASKYLPIKAHDLEKEHIERAKKGRYNFERFEEQSADIYLGPKFSDYFNYIYSHKIKVSPNLTKHVDFSQSNILDDVKTIDFNDTVLLARNCWHYLKDKDIINLAKNLSNRMNKSSLLVIGDYDKEYNIDKILRKYDFYETQVKNVFEKIK